MIDDPSAAHRTDLRTGHTAPSGHPLPDYSEYSDDRLRECYRRNNRLLQGYGVDWRTIRTLCTVEERLHARDIDSNDVIEGLDA